MKRIKSLFISGTLLLSVLLIPLSAQIPNTMYFMPGVPQSNRINPAIQPGCGFYLGAPVVAPVRIQIGSSSLAFNDVIYNNSDIDSLITPFHPLADKEAFLDNLSEVNYFNSEAGVSLASIGFRAGKSFISLDATVRMNASFYYPQGVFDYLMSSGDSINVLSIGGLGTDVTAYTEIAMGWSRKDFLIPNLDIGLRGKMLFGLANVYTANSDFTIETSTERISAHSQMQINASAPSFVTFSNDFDNGGPVIIDEDFFNISSLGDIPSKVGSLFSLDQFGLALDLGASYRPVPELLISASLLDFGGINWKNAAEGSYNFDYDFTGVELNPFSDIDTTFISELADSLMGGLNFIPGESYYARLNSKLFIGASYYPVEKIGFGFLSRTDFLNNKIAQQFTGSVNMTTGKFINLSLSYSYINSTFNNVGAGLSLNLGPLNMYIISDNIISAAYKPLETRSANLWFGLNLTFGWKMKEKRNKKVSPMDRPLII